MISYLVINILISSWALSINNWMQIPERHKFPILFFAMLSWLFPFNLVSMSSNLDIINKTVYSIQNIGKPSDIQKTVQTFAPSLFELVMVLMLVGLIVFIVDLIRLNYSHNKFLKLGKPSGLYNVWIVDNLEGACVSGFWRPKIWINTKLFMQNEKTAVLAHERQHIRSGDVYWILIIGFIQRLFWFNPLVYLLNKNIREAIELRCDEACQKQLGNNNYQNQLAKILLTYHQSKPTSLLNEIAQNKSFQIKRIQQLSQEKSMKKKHKLQITVSLFAILLLSFVALAGQDELQNSLVNDNEALVKIDFKVTDQAAESDDLSGVKRQMVVQFDEWQEVGVREDYVKYKVSQVPSNEVVKQFMIEAQILNADRNTMHSPTLMVQADTVATIEVRGEVNNESEFNLSFEVVTK